MVINTERFYCELPWFLTAFNDERTLFHGNKIEETVVYFSFSRLSFQKLGQACVFQHGSIALGF